MGLQDQASPVFQDLPPNEATVECNAVPTTTLVAVDECDTSPLVTSSQVQLNGSCASNYILQRTWHAADACGNIGTFNQTLTVQDTMPPIILGLPGAATAECSAIPIPPTLATTDACSLVAPVTLLETRVSEGGCPSNYTLNRTWTAVDACGNRRSETQLIDVRDTIGPVFTISPQNMSVSCDGQGNLDQLDAWLASSGGAAAVDACSGSIVQWSNTSSQSDFVSLCGAAGYFDVTFTATDACGMHSSQTARFTIMVRFQSLALCYYVFGIRLSRCCCSTRGFFLLLD